MTDTDALSAQDQGEQAQDKSRPLKLAGYVYVLGDACMYAAAQARGKLSFNTGKKIGAVSWAAGGIGAGIYGNPNTERQLELHAAHLEKYLKEKGITIPADTRAQSKLLHERGTWEHAQNFLYEHPSEILNTGYLIGALTVLHDGFKEAKSGKTMLMKGWGWKHFDNLNTSMWIGGLVLAGALGGLLIRENPHKKDEEIAAEKPKTLVGRAIHYFKEKPLRFPAVMYGLNNIFLAAMAKQDWDESRPGGKYAGHKPYIFSATQLAAYVFANSMLMISSRKQIGEHGLAPQAQNELEDAAARVLAAQSPEVQRQLLTDVSEHLAKEKGITLDAGVIAAHLAQRVATLTQERLEPAVANVKWAAREQERKQAVAEAPAYSLS